MTIGQKIAEKRKRKGLTQEEVAERLGVTPQAVSKWENDASCPDITLLPKIAKLFETTTDDILSAEPTPEVVYVKENEGKNIDDMILRIRVLDKSDRVNVNLPMPLVRAAISCGMTTTLSMGKEQLSAIDFSALVTMIESGAMGRLVEIESADGGTVVIEVV